MNFSTSSIHKPFSWLLLIFLTFATTACEYEFTFEAYVENATDQSLIVIVPQTGLDLDTVLIAPGKTEMIHQFIEPTSRIPTPIECVSFWIDTAFSTGPKRLSLDLEAEENWETTQFDKFLYQSCLIRIDSSHLE